MENQNDIQNCLVDELSELDNELKKIIYEYNLRKKGKLFPGDLFYFYFTGQENYILCTIEKNKKDFVLLDMDDKILYRQKAYYEINQIINGESITI